MKRIINGKKYDTSTAEELADWWNGKSTSDFGYCAEKLYRKRTGEFFLHGKGGAMSGWAESCEGGRCVCDGEGIRPLTEAKAREWVEARANEKYEAIFGEVAE